MTKIYLTVTGAGASAEKIGPLTTGMVGIPVICSFGPEWEKLNRLMVFRSGQIKKDNSLQNEQSWVPAEVLSQAGQMLYIGVEGRNSDGSLVIPTVWAEVGRIMEGASASGDPALAPTPSQFERFMAEVENVDQKIEDALAAAKESGEFDGAPGQKGDKGDPGIVNIKDGSAAFSVRTAGSNEESETYTMGYYALTEGHMTTASGTASHAEGRLTTASGTTSHAEGTSATASGTASHAEGASTTASGARSHTEGYFAKASGNQSHAEGNSTTASGENAHAEGMYTTASGANSHVQGKYNMDDPEGKFAHIVGNGNASNPSNAHTLDWQGNAWFAGQVYVGGTGQDDPNAKKLGSGGGIDVTAAPGQIIKVKAVDETGKPTQWEAANLPSGGGAELDATLSDSTKAAPANILGEVKQNAEAAAHGATIAGEGALVVPFFEVYRKIMDGEVVVMDQFVHVSDEVPTMADLEAGFSMMMQFPLEAEIGLSGADAFTFEILPKAMDEEVFAQVVMELGDSILVAESALIVPSDQYVLSLSETETVTFPKKGIYVPPGITALRINGYSFSGGSKKGAHKLYISPTATVKYLHKTADTENNDNILTASQLKAMAESPEKVVLYAVFPISEGSLDMYVLPNVIAIQDGVGMIAFIDVEGNAIRAYTAEYTPSETTEVSQ